MIKCLIGGVENISLEEKHQVVVEVIKDTEDMNKLKILESS